MKTPANQTNPAKSDHGDELTCIQPCIHSAAATDSADQHEGIEVELFLDKLVEVAFAITSRQSKSDSEESVQ